MHVRTQARKKVTDGLMSLPITRSSVFNSPIHPLRLDQLPALKIFTPDEDASYQSLGEAGDVLRTFTLLIEGVDSANDDLADRLDDIAAEVEARIDEDPTFGGVLDDCVLETTRISPDMESEVSVGVITLSYRATLKSQAGSPDVIRSVKSGRFAVVKVDGLSVARLRSASFQKNAQEIEESSSQSQWQEYSSAAPGWSIELAVTPMLTDPAQQAMIIGVKVMLEVFPRGETSSDLFVGKGLVTGDALSIDSEGDLVRVIQLTGDGSLT
jgi:hypothetical protein